MREEGFEDVVASLRRWILALGLLALAGLVACGATRPRLIGFCVGWLLSLFSLDQIGAKARAVQQGTLGEAEATSMMAKTFLRRWAVIIAVLVASTKMGADPVAGALALLLLQAAVMCRSIASLFMGSGGDEPGEAMAADEKVS